MTVVGYPTPGKAKARQILEAFCGGAGGRVVDELPRRLEDGAAAFFGVTPATKPLWEQAKREGRAWYYLDNAYFHEARGSYFRATKNRLQHDGRGLSDGQRFAALDLEILPWRKGGRHVVLAPQSDEFMQVCAAYAGRWTDDALGALYGKTERELRVLAWNRDKTQWYADLAPNLVNCWCLVTYSSASAISALLAGVPAICTAEDCVVAPWCRADLRAIESPPRPEGREAIAAMVADQQWTLDEMRSGLAWAMVNA